MLPPAKQSIFSFFHRYAYAMVAAALVLFISIRLCNGIDWGGDFWTHVAVVRELKEHLLYPSNPIIVADTPHAFYSPYQVLVAAVAQLVHAGPVQILEFFALINLLFFLLAFRFFCKAVFPVLSNAVAALGLIFLLLLWGADPPFWSGFFHFYFLHYGLPYPSTFAMALSLVTLALFIKNPQPGWRSGAVITLLTTIVLLTHPTTALFLGTGLVTAAFMYGSRKNVWLTALVLPASIAICLLWPYYSFAKLFTGNNQVFHLESKELYHNLLRITWPTVVPVLLLKPFRERSTRFLTITSFLLILVFIAGYLSGLYGVARVLSAVMLLLQLGLAASVIRLLHEKRQHWLAGVPAMALLMALLFNSTLMRKTVRLNERVHYTKYEFLKAAPFKNAVLLADVNAGTRIPAFGGRVIANRYPLYWVADLEQRKADVHYFFSEAGDTIRRKQILNAYHPDYILIDDHGLRLRDEVLNWIRRQGSMIHRQDGIEVIRISSNG